MTSQAFKARTATLRRAGLPTRMQALLTAFWKLNATCQTAIVQLTEGTATATRRRPVPKAERRQTGTALLVLALSLLAGAASAQTTILSVDLSSFGAWKAMQVEDDGHPKTPKAWLLWLNPDWNDLGQRYQLVVPRPNGTLCAEDPFIVTDTFAHVELGAMDGRDVFMVFTPAIFQTQTTMNVIALDRRRCR